MTAHTPPPSSEQSVVDVRLLAKLLDQAGLVVEWVTNEWWTNTAIILGDLRRTLDCIDYDVKAQCRAEAIAKAEAKVAECLAARAEGGAA